MDLTSIIGMLLAVGFTVYGILSSGSLLTFLDLPSVYITVGGTIGTLLITAKGKNAKNFFKLFAILFKETKLDNEEIINNLVEWSMKARKEGLLSLEDTIQSISDTFIQKGMMMIVDGAEPETIKNVLELKIKGIINRHKSNRAMLDAGAALAPAFGMIGTLIGLVNMLKTLDDPSTIGPQMAVALITTFYGSILANIVFIPTSKKLKAKTEEEVYQKEMIIEGLLSIQAGENPNTIREKMLSFLDDKTVKNIETKNKKEQE
jgi:chemotaxis protein MotA